MEKCERESNASAERVVLRVFASATLPTANVIQEYIALPEVLIKTEYDEETFTPQKPRAEVAANDESNFIVKTEDELYGVSVEEELEIGPTLLQPQTTRPCSLSPPIEAIPDLSLNTSTGYKTSPSFCTILPSSAPPTKKKDEGCKENPGVPPEADSRLNVRSPKSTYQIIFREQSRDSSDVQDKSMVIEEGVDCKYCARLLSESRRSGTRTVECGYCKHSTTRKPDSTNLITLHTAEKPNMQSQKSLVKKLTSPCIDKKQFRCKYCEYSAHQFGAFIIHLRIHTGEKPYKCPMCEHRASRKAHLKTHMRTHTGEKPYKCEHCEYKASTQSILIKHRRIHTGVKPYECELCEYRASISSSLKNHMFTHTGEKLFKCEHCEYSASFKDRLRRHIRAHMGERPFKCQICDYRAPERAYLKLHMRRHTGEKPYKCQRCDYRASRYLYIKHHMLTKHEYAAVNTSLTQ